MRSIDEVAMGEEFGSECGLGLGVARGHNRGDVRGASEDWMIRQVVGSKQEAAER
jgi:hypothetical protein